MCGHTDKMNVIKGNVIYEVGRAYLTTISATVNTPINLSNAWREGLYTNMVQPQAIVTTLGSLGADGTNVWYVCFYSTEYSGSKKLV